MREILGDQAGTLRRLFRQRPPTVCTVFSTGAGWADHTMRLARRLARRSGPALVVDEAVSSQTLPEAAGAGRTADLLSALGSTERAIRLLVALPGGVSYLNVKAAALALPLLDEMRRERLLRSFQTLLRPFETVLVHAGRGDAADASAFLTSAPSAVVLAELSADGVREALGRAQDATLHGRSRLGVVTVGGRDAAEAEAFVRELQGIWWRKLSLRVAGWSRLETLDARAWQAMTGEDGGMAKSPGWPSGAVGTKAGTKSW